MTLIAIVGKVDRQLEHILLHCEKYMVERLRLRTKIGDIWLDSNKSGNLNFDMKLLLNPFYSKLGLADSQKVAEEFENFMQDINFKFKKTRL